MGLRCRRRHSRERSLVTWLPLIAEPVSMFAWAIAVMAGDWAGHEEAHDKDDFSFRMQRSARRKIYASIFGLKRDLRNTQSRRP
jgi:hypothetical protein